MKCKLPADYFRTKLTDEGFLGHTSVHPLWLADLADRGKSAARVDWQQAFLLTVVFVLALARPNSAHAFQPLDPNSRPFIPVLEVATSPNGGTTYGLMTVFKQHDDHGDASSIIAPDITNEGWDFVRSPIRSWSGLSTSGTATKASLSLAELTIPSDAYGWDRDPDTEVESRRAVRFPLSACNTRRDGSPLPGRV